MQIKIRRALWQSVNPVSSIIHFCTKCRLPQAWCKMVALNIRTRNRIHEDDLRALTSGLISDQLFEEQWKRLSIILRHWFYNGQWPWNHKLRTHEFLKFSDNKEQQIDTNKIIPTNFLNRSILKVPLNN